MSKFIGRLNEVGLSKESTRGTSVIAAPTFWIDKMDATIENKPEVLVNEGSFGRIEDSVGGEVVKEGASGEIAGKILDKSFGLIMLAAFGQESSTTAVGSATKHLFTVLNTAQHQSLVIQIKNPNRQLAFTLAMLNSLEIRAEVGKLAEYTAEFQTKKGITASNTPSYTAQESTFNAKNISVKVADTVAGLDAATAIAMRSATIKIDKNLEGEPVFGSLDPNDILNKQFSAELTLVKLFDEATYVDLYEAGTKKAVRVRMINTNGSATIELNFDFAQVLFTNWEKTTGIDELSAQTITGKATYKLSETSMVEAYLTNLKAGAY